MMFDVMMSTRQHVIVVAAAIRRGRWVRLKSPRYVLHGELARSNSSVGGNRFGGCVNFGRAPEDMDGFVWANRFPLQEEFHVSHSNLSHKGAQFGQRLLSSPT